MHTPAHPLKGISHIKIAMYRDSKCSAHKNLFMNFIYFCDI